jgi:predicted nuclease of predicted toxin-antitoxin system
MKLLLDENLSRRLAPFLQEAYPGSSQVVLPEVLRLLIDRQDTIHEAFAAGATCVELWP